MEVAAEIAPAITEPFSSQMTGPVEPVLTPGHLASKMQYPPDATQLRQHITQIILNSSEPKTVLPNIAGVLGKIFQVDACLIATRVSHQLTPQLGYWRAGNDLAMEPQHSWQLLEHPALAAILANSSLLAITDIQKPPRKPLAGLPWEAMPIRAVLGIQTWFHSVGNGAIVLGRVQPSDWHEWEKELLKSVSDEVAIAISQVDLQQQVSTATNYRTLINEIALALQSSREMEPILQIVTQQTAQALAVDRGFILLLKYANPFLGKRKADKASWRNEASAAPASTSLNLPATFFPKVKAVVVSEWPSTALQSDQSSVVTDELNSSSTAHSTLNTDHSPILNASFGLSECPLCQQAFLKAPDIMAIPDQRLEPRLKSDERIAHIFAQDVMPAILMVPLENQGTVLGFLVLQHLQPRSWHQEELELMKWVSAQASTAIIQAQTLRQVQAVVEERTYQLQRSLEVQAKLYEKTRQQIDQLRHLNQLKDEFLATVSHELKTPLTTMSVAIELLRQPGLPSEMHTKYMDILKQQCTHEINLINDLLALQKLESHKQPINLQKIDIKQLIVNLAATFKNQWADKGLTLNLDLPKRSVAVEAPTLTHPAVISNRQQPRSKKCGNATDAVEEQASVSGSMSAHPSRGAQGAYASRGAQGAYASRGAQGAHASRSLMIQTDPDSLNRILLELLTNAGKYSDPDSTVKLRVTQLVNQEMSQIVLTLSNTGPGILPTDLTYIFDKFRRGQGVTQQAVQGTGLGLALVKSLVQLLNGTIDVSSCPIEHSQSCETCFTLTLPQFFDGSTKA